MACRSEKIDEVPSVNVWKLWQSADESDELAHFAAWHGVDPDEAGATTLAAA